MIDLEFEKYFDGVLEEIMLGLQFGVGENIVKSVLREEIANRVKSMIKPHFQEHRRMDLSKDKCGSCPVWEAEIGQDVWGLCPVLKTKLKKDAEECKGRAVWRAEVKQLKQRIEALENRELDIVEYYINGESAPDAVLISPSEGLDKGDSRYMELKKPTEEDHNEIFKRAMETPGKIVQGKDDEES